MKLKNILLAGVVLLLAACTQSVQKAQTLSGLSVANFQAERMARRPISLS